MHCKAMMATESNALLFIRVFLLLVCIGLFALQSYQEMGKFATQLRSTAISTERERGLSEVKT